MQKDFLIFVATVMSLVAGTSTFAQEPGADTGANAQEQRDCNLIQTEFEESWGERNRIFDLHNVARRNFDKLDTELQLLKLKFEIEPRRSTEDQIKALTRRVNDANATVAQAQARTEAANQRVLRYEHLVRGCLAEQAAEYARARERARPVPNNWIDLPPQDPTGEPPQIVIAPAPLPVLPLSPFPQPTSPTASPAAPLPPIALAGVPPTTMAAAPATGPTTQPGGFRTHSLSRPFTPGGQCPANTAFEVCKFGPMNAAGVPASGWVGCVDQRDENFVCKSSNPPQNCSCTQDRTGKVPPLDQLVAMAPQQPASATYRVLPLVPLSEAMAEPELALSAPLLGPRTLPPSRLLPAPALPAHTSPAPNEPILQRQPTPHINVYNPPAHKAHTTPRVNSHNPPQRHATPTPTPTPHVNIHNPRTNVGTGHTTSRSRWQPRVSKHGSGITSKPSTFRRHVNIYTPAAASSVRVKSNAISSGARNVGAHKKKR